MNTRIPLALSRLTQKQPPVLPPLLLSLCLLVLQPPLPPPYRAQLPPALLGRRQTVPVWVNLGQRGQDSAASVERRDTTLGLALADLSVVRVLLFVFIIVSTGRVSLDLPKRKIGHKGLVSTTSCIKQ